MCVFKITSHEMTSWDVILFVFPLALAFKENSIFWKKFFIVVQLKVLVIPEHGPPAALQVMR